ncbi:hypothetical protein MHYP_G00251050 [Metynnis hypsauchen]
MLLIFIASALTCSAAEFSVFVPNGSVSERLGSSAVLPCGLAPALNAKTFDVRWYKNDYNNPVLLYKDLNVQENPGDVQYRGRVSLIGELEKGNVSLRLENLTLADGGEYVCFVKSVTWYAKASVNLIVRVLGSFPLFSLAEFGDQVNVSCASAGWSPKPTLTWRDKRGRELTTSHIYYKTDSEGLVSVSSWLLFSPSESEWISCSVSLSDQEMVDSRVLPVKEFWREAFISILVFSLIIIIILTAVLLERQVKSQESIPAEAFPLTVSAEEMLQMWNKLKKQKEKLTVDPDTRHRSLTTTRDGTGVYFGTLSSSNPADTVPPFPPALSKEGFSSGQKYWEVTMDLKTK